MAKDQTTWMRRWPIQYGAALAAMTFAFLSRQALGRSLGSELPTYIIFYPSIMIVSLVVGIRQGLFATSTAVLMTAYWILPRDGLVVRRSGDIVGLALFTTTSIFVAVMAEFYHRSRQRAAAYEGTLAASRYTRTLIEASLDPLVTISREGKITDVNQATESVTGAAREQLIGSDFCDYFSEPEKARVGYQQVFAAGFVRDYPLAIRHTSGRITDVLYNATVFRNQKGEVEGVFATARDISERKRAVKEIQRYTKELERSNTELQDFASIASHDLQEPLRKVLAFGEHLREHLGSNLDEEGSNFLTRMENAAQRMSVLIEALLQYSRVTARAKPFVPVDLTQLVFGVLADMEDRITKTGAGVEFMPLPKVMADPMQMRQLLQNLLGNALKFRRPDTKPQLVIEGTRTNGWCEITVADNGIGFDEKYLDRIFRPFQRLHGRGYYEGSGMGLAICRKVVARHGGTLTAHSRPGEGSTFVVTLPAAALTHGRETPWQIEAEAKPSESCSPRTMTTISS
jgi:PAS domain S-box-containing protein